MSEIPLTDFDLTILFRLIVTSFIAEPSRLAVTVLRTGDIATVKVQVAMGDLGTLIGRQGRMARSLRTILSAIAHRTGEQYRLDLSDDDDEGAGHISARALSEADRARREV